VVLAWRDLGIRLGASDGKRGRTTQAADQTFPADMRIVPLPAPAVGKGTASGAVLRHPGVAEESRSRIPNKGARRQPALNRREDEARREGRKTGRGGRMALERRAHHSRLQRVQKARDLERQLCIRGGGSMKGTVAETPGRTRFEQVTILEGGPVRPGNRP